MSKRNNKECNAPPVSDAAARNAAARNEETSLLQRLHRREFVVHPITTEEEAKQKQQLILDHRSEFPSKLRRFIEEGSELPPEKFLGGFYEALKELFWCLPYAPRYGLDDTIDTEEEVELAIRFFPNLLNAQYSTTNPRSKLYLACPIHMLLLQPRTISFVPLLMRMGEEMGFYMGASNFADLLSAPSHWGKSEDIDLSNYRKYILRELLFYQFGWNFDQSHNQGLRHQSLAVLKRLRDERMLTGKDIFDYDLLLWLISQAEEEMTLFRNLSSEEFMERLRILIEWNPSLLEDCGNGRNLLEAVMPLYSVPYLIHEVFKIGMEHYPADLGFIHHMFIYKYGPSPHEYITSIYWSQCSVEDADNVLRLIKKGIKDHSIEDVVTYVAKNDKISVEGLYTLVRLDPIASIRALQKLKDCNRSAALKMGEPETPA